LSQLKSGAFRVTAKLMIIKKKEPMTRINANKKPEHSMTKKKTKKNQSTPTEKSGAYKYHKKKKKQ